MRRYFSFFPIGDILCIQQILGLGLLLHLLRCPVQLHSAAQIQRIVLGVQQTAGVQAAFCRAAGIPCKVQLFRRHGALLCQCGQGVAVIIRLHANEIPLQSRYGSGVRVMRLGENDKVMVLARTDHDDEAQTEKIDASEADAEPTAEQLAEMEAADAAAATEAPEADPEEKE